MSNEYYVYALIDPRTELPFYIGKGNKLRAYSHTKETKANTKNKRKWEYIQSLKEIDLVPTISILLDNLLEDEAYNKEKEYIILHGRRGIDENGILTNLCLDNRPPNNKGKKRSEETVAKISAAQSKRFSKNKMHLSEETRQKMSDSMRGKNNPQYGSSLYKAMVIKYGEDEAKVRWGQKIEKTSKINTGKIRSEESRKNISKGRKLMMSKANFRWVVDTKSGLVKRLPLLLLEDFLLANSEWKKGRK